MDMIYTDADRRELGVLHRYDLDMAFGADENDFSLTLARADHCCAGGAFVFAEGTDLGGIIDSVRSKNDSDSVIYTGRTWYGMLNSRVILPLQDGEQAAGKLRRLPKGYTELDYIETTGTQYVDTGFVPNQDTRIVCEFLYKGGNGIYGARSTVSTRNFSVRVINGYWQMGYGDGVASGTIPSDTANWHIADQNKNSLYIDGQLVVTREYVPFSAPHPIAIGAIKAGSMYYGEGRYRSCQIYDDGVLVRDLVPCLNAEGLAGMFDLVNGSFHRGAGSSALEIGEIIQTTDVIVPGSDENGNSLLGVYLVVTGDANRCIAMLLERMNLSYLFDAAEHASGILINKYRFPRYCKGYDGIHAMLAAAGARLHCECKNGRVTLSAVPVVHHSEAALHGAVRLDASRIWHRVNHLVCLGQGELAARTVLHLYADADGRISTVQTLFGADEIADVYDNANASDDDLEKNGRSKLADLQQTAAADAVMQATDAGMNIGDTIDATDEITGISATVTITKKIVTVRDGQATIDYKAGV